jgi:hypothetical protein
MNTREIEHMWKVASNNPNHDTNWHDPVVMAFAKLVAQHERESCAKVCDRYVDSSSDHEAGTAMNIQDAIRARGQE